MGRVEGKVAVVTGAARGIGRETAKLLAKEGASVAINDIDEAPLLETAREIEAAGGKVVAYAGDLTKRENAQKLLDTAAGKFGTVDILVNNAGLLRDAMIHRMTEAQWDISIDVNLKAVFNCIQAASKYMMKEGYGGSIINVTSTTGLDGNIGQVNYAAAKSGLIGLAKTVAKEWERYGVTCNCIAFGFVDTRMTREKETGDEVMGEKVGIPKKIRDAVVERIAGKIMKPEDAAKPILFLASDEARFVTGTVLNCSAGLSWY